MTIEVDSIIAVHKASGAPGVVTDISSPGIHIPWNPPKSHGSHYRPATYSLSGQNGTAVDFGNRPERLTDEQSLEVFNVFKPYGETGQLQELFCGQSDWCVYGGNWLRWTSLPKKTRDIIRPAHRNHLHVSVLPGVFLKPLQQPTNPPLSQSQETDMSDALTITYANGHKTVVTPDGAVKNAGTPFYGSIYDVSARDKKDWVSCFAAIAVDPEDETKGYTLFNDKPNSKYSFTPQWWAEHGHK